MIGDMVLPYKGAHHYNNLVIDIPSDVFNKIESLWLKMTSIALLDSAFTSTDKRSGYLRLLNENPDCIVFEHPTCEPTCSHLTWIWRRGLLIDRFIVSSPLLMFCQSQADQSCTKRIFSNVCEIRLRDRILSKNDQLYLLNMINSINRNDLVVRKTDFVRFHSLFCMEGLSDCLRPVFHALINKGHMIKRVTVGSCFWSQNNVNNLLTNDDVVLLAMGCPQLTDLEVLDGSLLTDDSMHAIADFSHHLKCLTLQKCFNIGDSLSVLESSSCAKYLSKLILDVGRRSSMTLSSISSLIKQTPNLTLLTIIGLNNNGNYALALEENTRLQNDVQEFCPKLVPDSIPGYYFLPGVTKPLRIVTICVANADDTENEVVVHT